MFCTGIRYFFHKRKELGKYWCYVSTYWFAKMIREVNAS